ncbi:MAG: type II secretion system protein [Candidatus Taylorbacteria bacterium]|nr:type II secretion system protein [Candidatus Taylorbacteria bacterium]
MKGRRKAFTLIELLVVVSIISLLSSVVLASLNAAREKARTSRARQDMYQVAKAISIAQGEGFRTLLSITGSTCSDCVCRTGANLMGDTGTCYSAWVNVLTTVQANTGGVFAGITNITRDPWGSPYAVDENQGEGGAGACATRDGLRSVGPNGIWGDSDDITQEVPLSAKCP